MFKIHEPQAEDGHFTKSRLCSTGASAKLYSCTFRGNVCINYDSAGFIGLI